MSKASKDFLPLNLAVLTVSDSRGEAEDTSGHYLKEAAEEAGHRVAAQAIVKDNLYKIRAVVSAWIVKSKGTESCFAWCHSKRSVLRPFSRAHWPEWQMRR